MAAGDWVSDAGIIPAYAGSTRAPARIPHLVQDHPRIRGEHRHNREKHAFQPGSSPHTRGALARLGRVLEIQGIIPAYAGSTTGMYQSSAIISDHPRIRGEH